MKSSFTPKIKMRIFEQAPHARQAMPSYKVLQFITHLGGKTRHIQPIYIQPPQFANLPKGWWQSMHG